MSTPNLDPVAVVTAAVAVLLGAQASEVVGPYAVIILAATISSSWSLGRRQDGPLGVWSALWFFLRVSVMASLLTIGLVEFIGAYVFRSPSPWLLVPVALGLGAVGDRWPQVFEWCARLIRKRVSSSAGIDK